MSAEEPTNLEGETSFEHPKQLKYLLEKVDDEIKGFTDRANKSFRTVKLFKWTSVIISALITIVLGINLRWLGPESGNSYVNAANYSMIAKDIALVLGAILTVLGTMAIFWNIERYWLQNKLTKQQLKLLRNEIYYLKHRQAPITQTELDAIFNKFQNIMKQFHLYWEGILQDIDRKDTDKVKSPEKDDS